MAEHDAADGARGRARPGRARKPESRPTSSKPGWRFTAKAALAEFQRDQCTDLAAALTYYSVLSVFPAILALVSLLGVFGQGEATTDALLDIVRARPGPGGRPAGRSDQPAWGWEPRNRSPARARNSCRIIASGKYQTSLVSSKPSSTAPGPAEACTSISAMSLKPSSVPPPALGRDPARAPAWPGSGAWPGLMAQLVLVDCPGARPARCGHPRSAPWASHDKGTGGCRPHCGPSRATRCADRCPAP